MPGICWLCHLPLRLSQHGICSLCLRQLPALPPLCPRCALPSQNSSLPCGRCLNRPPPWRALVCVSDYVPPISQFVHRLKFSGVTALSVMLARLLLLSWLQARRRYAVPRPDLLLVVPLHKQRLWRRGFNQAALLAKPLAHWLQCECQPHGIRRQRAALPQHQLNAHQRQHNLRGAFRLDRDVAARHIVLIDDVVTTGSTVAEISHLLLAGGAASVQIWCLCRTL